MAALCKLILCDLFACEHFLLYRASDSVTLLGITCAGERPSTCNPLAFSYVLLLYAVGVMCAGERTGTCNPFALSYVLVRYAVLKEGRHVPANVPAIVLGPQEFRMSSTSTYLLDSSVYDVLVAPAGTNG